MKKKKLMCSLSIILATIALTSCKRPSNDVTSSSTTSSQTTSSSSSSTHTHSYSKWEVTKNPTLEETGTIKRKCTSNDDTETFTLPKLNETDYTYTVTKASTCVAKGEGKYTYNKDGQDLEFTVELEIDIDNHASLDSNGKCTACHEYQGLHYSFDEGNKTCSVIGVGFQTYDEETGTYYSHSPKNVVIPEKIKKGTNEYSVTSIGGSAFANCKTMESVEIPDSVTSIESSAFVGCASLESITIPNTVTNIYSYAFSECTSLESIQIPSSVTTIGDRAFNGCVSLKSIVIPSSVTSIGLCVFASCTSLERIVVVEGNTTYTSRNSSGEECNAIIKKADNSLITGCKNTIIPNTVTSISPYAFYNCTSLKTIEIPNIVTTIGKDAFDGCTSLKSIVIPGSVTSINAYAFVDCISLESIVVEKDNTTYDSRDNCNAIIETSTNTLLEGCKKTVIPKTVSKIGQNAFYKCASLESIEIPSSVTSINGEAFRGCTSLKSIVIPGSVTSINAYALVDCISLESIVVEKDNTVYTSRNNSDEECSAIIKKSDNTLIIGCKNTVIPDSVTSIGGIAFYQCTSLESIIIPNSVTSIGTNAFDKCTFLKSIVIPNSVTSIGGYAFYGCTSLESVNIPSSVTKIGNFTFYGCTALESINIPSSVTSIEVSAFRGCTSLESLVVDKANSAYTSQDSSEKECNAVIRKSDNTLIIGCKTTTIPDSVTSIGEYAFFSCRPLETITIPNSVSSIGKNAFKNCISLKSIIISKDIATISTTAFYGIAESIDVFVDGSYEDGVSDALTNIFGDRLIYKSDDRPTDTTHSYWHYVDGKPVKW